MIRKESFLEEVMFVSCNLKEESAKERGVRRGDSKGKSQGNRESMNNTKRM